MVDAIAVIETDARKGCFVPKNGVDYLQRAPVLLLL